MKVHRTRSVRRVVVTTEGRNLVSHAGTALLAEMADRSGLTAGMSKAMADCGISWRRHDPGVVLTHLAVAIADGADCLSDFSAISESAELFGEMASLSTAFPAVRRTTSVQHRQIPQALQAARDKVWAEAPPGDIVIDIDATPLNCDSDKQDAALPAAWQLGHQPGDDPSLVRHHLVVRTDSAGCTHALVDGLTEANIEYSIGHPVDKAVRGALLLFQEKDWLQAIKADGSVREGAFVAEIGELMEQAGLNNDPPRVAGDPLPDRPPTSTNRRGPTTRGLKACTLPLHRHAVRCLQCSGFSARITIVTPEPPDPCDLVCRIYSPTSCHRSILHCSAQRAYSGR